LVNSSINPFGMRITVTSGHLYHARAIIRIEGGTGSITSGPLTFRTPGGGGSNPTSSPPPGGSTATPPPGGGSTSTPPPGGSTPTPTPGPPHLRFSSNMAPWNGSEWRVSAVPGTIASIVDASQNWTVTQTTGTGSWLDVEWSGEPGTPLVLRVTQPNRTGNIREATVTVRSGNLSRNLEIVQLPAPVAIRGTRVIESFGRDGYVDVSGATATTIRYPSRGSASYPIWYFVHLEYNVFAIRNNTTRGYFTETGGQLSHEANLNGLGSASYNIRQRWLLIPQANGTYRIRSASADTLYVEDGVFNVTLATRNTSDNWQSWRIGYIWHHHRNYFGADYNWVGFWPGRINIRPEALVTSGASDFYAAVATAQSTWGAALGITSLFNDVESRTDANIRVYWCTPTQFQREAGLMYLPDERYGATSITPRRRGISYGREFVTTINAGGATRNVYRLVGTDNLAMIAGVWSHHGSRGVNLAPFVTTHELGHALGYIGHSPNSGDVMRRVIERWQTPDSILRPAEIEHLRQIYRRFR
ncbi:MAG: matrixin family metalloprotease, partial [Defluviitaleaceae bacterium]|nr:matrixin family metalloprotease [Defluviitaleaceae bacterium]